MRIRTRAARFALCAALLLACHEGSPVTYATPAASPTRRAVLIGIDDYSASRIARRGREPVQDRAWPTLRGAGRDVDLLREMLVLRYGFEPAGIVTLKNQEATRDAIIQAIEKHLIAPAAKGDVTLFYYAGHGSQVENSLSTEPDQKDESIVPADSRLGALDIRDKQLAVLFNRILDQKARLTVIFDSCNSGSITRALVADSGVRAVNPDRRDVRDAAEPPAPESRGALVLTGSKDFARAFEVEDDKGNYHGVFSWALLRAMRAATDGEAAADTVLRAQAMMRADSPYQDPVMSGNASVQLTPLLSADGAKPAAKAAVAIEKINPDDTVILQGGWVNGLTIGTELRARQGGMAGVRIRITGMLGLGRSEGRIVDTGARAARADLTTGALLDIGTWSAPSGRPLRVWIPEMADISTARAYALKLRDSAVSAGVLWVDDPTRTTPSHVLRWRENAWELVGPGGAHQTFRGNAPASLVMANLPRGTSLFLQLPAPSALVRSLGVGPGTDYDSIHPEKEPAGVDYVLAGRLAGEGIEYAWMRPAVHKEDERDTPLPSRSDWHSPDPVDDAAITLRHLILRLHKIRAWHHLESPPQSKSPYRLTLRNDEDGTEVGNGAVKGGRRYRLVLRAVDPSATSIAPRYYYVFGIDSYGRSVLLFPLRGSVENRFPINRDEAQPEIAIGLVKATAPYGLDTYVLISADESLPNPSVLEWSGVRTRGPRGGTGLEELLSLTGGSSRAPEAVWTSPIWSIDRVPIRSVPPDDEAAAHRSR